MVFVDYENYLTIGIWEVLNALRNCQIAIDIHNTYSKDLENDISGGIKREHEQNKYQ